MRKFVVLGDIVLPGGEIAGGYVAVRDGKIEKIGSGTKVKGYKNQEILDYRGAKIIPGLIDIHVHGGGGADFLDDDPYAIETIISTHRRYGTTSLLAGVMTAPREEMLAALHRLREAAAGRKEILGIYLEGPYLNPRQKGCQPEEELRLPDRREAEEFLAAAGPALKIFALAPELPGAAEVIQEAHSRGIVVAAGHTNATFAEMTKAFTWGVSHAAHLYNAMRGLHQREPGAVGAFLQRREATVELIADGVHVHPEMIRFLLAVKDKENIILVSDATAACGMPDGTYRIGGQKLKLVKGVGRLEDGTLAGGAVPLLKGVETMVRKLGLSLGEAVAMASFNPARLLGIAARKGSLEPGKDADLVVLDGFRPLLVVSGGEIHKIKNPS
ncbi:MAG: N-acetylglucosamine-6-phosphate deacetylase [Eubacteriales bacterium]|nr:N-acetylglucosamine-6-phosphate deacetylase [Eubacteriales bacterium]MDN5363226.1 N-acetylglucosamine-6-phosphate deacetylase [Eubacteriales bacterium]